MFDIPLRWSPLLNKFKSHQNEKSYLLKFSAVSSSTKVPYHLWYLFFFFFMYLYQIFYLLKSPHKWVRELTKWEDKPTQVARAAYPNPFINWPKFINPTPPKVTLLILVKKKLHLEGPAETNQFSACSYVKSQPKRPKRIFNDPQFSQYLH